MINQVTSTTPFRKLEILMLHQIPFSPSAVPDRISAIGIRADVSTTLSTAGGIVFPRPENAPVVIISIQRKISDIPRICRYSTPIGTSSCSGIKIRKIYWGRKSRIAVQKIPHTMVITDATRYPFRTRLIFPAP